MTTHAEDTTVSVPEMPCHYKQFSDIHTPDPCSLEDTHQASLHGHPRVQLSIVQACNLREFQYH